MISRETLPDLAATHGAAVAPDERRILELIATGADLTCVLDGIARLFEAGTRSVFASITIIENGTTMRPGAAPSLPAGYGAEIDGLQIGVGVGSCGTAAATKQRVVVEDIATDPLWEGCRSFVLPLGLRACWSTPILATDGEVLGTFGIYDEVSRGPTQAQLDLADRASRLAAIALERQRGVRRIQLLHEQLEERIRERTRQLESAVEELQQAREKAEAASAAKSYFLANMSHEIRSPLTVVLGFSQLLGKALDLTPKHREMVSAIEASGEHLLTLINGVLEMSKIESGHVALNKTNFELRAVLAEVACMLRLPADAKGLALNVSVSDDVPRVIATDAGKLRQVLVNLVGNAIKFTERGHVIIRVHARLAPERGGRTVIHFEIEDTGPGISEDGQRVLFRPFVQVGGNKHQPGGTGLGLAISQSFVDIMGGEISVRSRLGQGSTFHFEILADVADVIAPTVAPVLESDAQAHGRPASILLVDDSEMNRRLLLESLRPCGFSLSQAASGRECLREFESHCPNLVLMDLRMPEMDGYETMRHIRARHGSQSVRIIAVTASAFEEDAPAVVQSGADELLRKPFRIDELMSAVQRQLAALGADERGFFPSP
ncbi:MAG TPA: ATP-binding protein [Polyangiales bacterium]|nr:ATP-binding protein [Polyangiales bacterium]